MVDHNQIYWHNSFSGAEVSGDGDGEGSDTGRDDQGYCITLLMVTVLRFYFALYQLAGNRIYLMGLFKTNN